MRWNTQVRRLHALISQQLFDAPQQQTYVQSQTQPSRSNT